MAHYKLEVLFLVVLFMIFGLYDFWIPTLTPASPVYVSLHLFMVPTSKTKDGPRMCVFNHHHHQKAFRNNPIPPKVIDRD